ncbi:RsmB/NOP family class I SAM-dependent RNA methyltransferase [Shewanella yunxiaonensis]|uniref:RsmB/NOP family class I SAM-dependent RNA methyltransferase n=1 Tax=Shewanella yunxiaonensis TaxID=2829809 RepID=A0ABX7YVE8_9GAMM|nr:RsmB/NOP family class I SAM-dependent RNA methyltransferase [Shewanella yunxiaonensis]QUN06652.1 RsmB/NOP family class I SAM-dependent RNA methyltransferase [Shewanella yunxiaonensis]
MTPAEKYADSYAKTIHQLFTEILQSRQSADRVLAAYFRLNKKHGGRDRRIIRETLFALFRWYGWLKLLPAANDEQLWFRQLAACGLLEQHSWQPTLEAWQLRGGLLPHSGTPWQSLTQAAEQLQLWFAGTDFPAEALVPQWFWQQLSAMNDTQKLTLLQSFCSRPPLWLRVQQLSTTDAKQALATAGFSATESAYFEDAISLGHQSINLNELTLYKDGQLEVQDLASQVIGHICNPQAGEQWWDACSGAGGKSLQLASLMKNQGQIVASDIRQSALLELEKRAARSQCNIIKSVLWQSETAPVATQAFDGVLVDAPCSCTGTWRRNPDMRWLDHETAVTEKPPLQLDILQRASNAVKSGGVLVYATCSLADAENRGVVDAFLAANPQFTLQSLEHPFTGERTEYLTVWPYQADTDGMFVVRMLRQ